jgi:hypothetical protein
MSFRLFAGELKPIHQLTLRGVEAGGGGGGGGGGCCSAVLLLQSPLRQPVEWPDAAVTNAAGGEDANSRTAAVTATRLAVIFRWHRITIKLISR